MLLMGLLAAACTIAPLNQREVTPADVEVMQVTKAYVIGKIGASNIPLLAQTIQILTEPQLTSYPTEVDANLYARLRSRNQFPATLTSFAFAENQPSPRKSDVDRWIELTSSSYLAIMRRYPHGLIGISLPVYSDNGRIALVAYHDVDLLPAMDPEHRLFVDQQFIELRREAHGWIVVQQFGFTAD